MTDVHLITGPDLEILKGFEKKAEALQKQRDALHDEMWGWIAKTYDIDIEAKSYTIDSDCADCCGYALVKQDRRAEVIGKLEEILRAAVGEAKPPSATTH